MMTEDQKPPMDTVTATTNDKTETGNNTDRKGIKKNDSTAHNHKTEEKSKEDAVVNDAGIDHDHDPGNGKRNTEMGGGNDMEKEEEKENALKEENKRKNKTTNNTHTRSTKDRKKNEERQEQKRG